MPQFDTLYEALKTLTKLNEGINPEKIAELKDCTNLKNIDVLYSNMGQKTRIGLKCKEEILKNSIIDGVDYRTQSGSKLLDVDYCLNVICKKDNLKIPYIQLIKKIIDKYLETSIDTSDDYNNYEIIFTKSARMLRKYGEGSYCCVTGHLGDNSEMVKKGLANPGDWVSGRGPYFLKYYFTEHNYSYYWGIILNKSTNEKFYVGFDRTSGKIKEFRDKYDKEITDSSYKNLKEYVENKFKEFQLSSNYSETLDENIDEYNGNKEGYIISEEYFSHSTTSLDSLYNILNRLDKKGEKSDFNLNPGINGTVSITNQFIRIPEGDQIGLPAPIKRNPNKFKYGIVLKAEIFKGIELEKYDDFKTYLTTKGNLSATKVEWIARTKDKAFMRIYFWPGIFDIPFELYEKIKHIIEIQPDNVITKNTQSFIPSDTQLSYVSTKFGGKYSPADFIEGLKIKDGGPALTTDSKYEKYLTMTKEDVINLNLDLKDRIHVFLNQKDVEYLTNHFQANEFEQRTSNNIKFDIADVVQIWLPRYFIATKENDEVSSKWTGSSYNKVFDIYDYWNKGADSIIFKKRFRTDELNNEFTIILAKINKIFDFLKSNPNIEVKFYDVDTTKELK